MLPSLASMLRMGESFLGSMTAQVPAAGEAVPTLRKRQEDVVSGSDGQTITLSSIGASFSGELMSAWSRRVDERSDGAFTYKYDPAGSGAGVGALLSADPPPFVGSDVPLTSGDATRAGEPGAVLHLPVTLGAIAPIVHIPQLEAAAAADAAAGPASESSTLQTLHRWRWAVRMSPSVLAAIFQGDIEEWRDERILALQAAPVAAVLAGISDTIVVVRRTDSSGSTEILTSYLSRFSNGTWEGGVGKVVDTWARYSAGTAGSSEVATLIGAAHGSLGYLSSSAVDEAAGLLPVALLTDGIAYAQLTSASAAAAVEGVSLPEPEAIWQGFDILGGRVTGSLASWPLSTLSYVIVWSDLRAWGDVGCAAKAFLMWAMTADAQYEALNAGLIPLPTYVSERNLEAIQRILVSNDALANEFYSVLSTERVVQYVKPQ
jgi:phosphate transport system substrate-binding protein